MAAEGSEHYESLMMTSLENIKGFAEVVMREAERIECEVDKGKRPREIDLDEWRVLDSELYRLADEHRRLRDHRNELQVSAIEDLL